MAKKFSEEIEQNANLLLNSTLQQLFINADLKLRNYPFHVEKGIDFAFEIENRDDQPRTLAMFFLQNKGSDAEFKPLKKGMNEGKISFQLDDVRQVDYFCAQLDQPVIICICDLETKTIYWEPIQLSTEVYLERVKQILKDVESKKRKTPAIQVYFDTSKCLLNKGEVVQENFQEFLSDIEKSREYITARNFQRVNNRDDDEGDTIDIDKNLSILDQLHDYLSIRFKEIWVLPTRFWAYSYPFKKSFKPYFIYDEFRLQTDSEDVYNFFRSVRIHRDLSLEFTEEKYIKDVKDYEEKTKFILRTLNRNLVFYIDHIDKDEKIDLRYLEETNCDCVRCSYEKLKLSNVFEKLNEPSGDIETISKQAYINYQLGFFINSANGFLSVVAKATKEGQHLRAFIAKYNLSKLYRFIKYQHTGEEVDEELLLKLEKIKNQLDFDFLRMGKHRAEAKWIKENRFFTDFKHEIEETFVKLKDYYFSQLWGGRGNNSYAGELYTNHAILETFLVRNFVIYDYFSEYSQLTEMYTEALLSSHAVHPSMYSRLTHFNDWIVTVLIFHGDAETIQKYCNRYFLSSVAYEKTAVNVGFMQLVRNLFTDERLEEVYAANNLDSGFYFQQKYTKFLGNIMVLACYLVLSDKDVNEFVLLLKNFLTWQKQIKYHRVAKFINLFFQKKAEQIDISIVNAYFSFMFENDYLHDEQFLDELADTYEKKKEGLAFSIEVRQQIEALMGPACPLCNRQHEQTMWVSFYRLANNQVDKDYVKEKIFDILQQRFNWRLYYLTAIYGIVGVDNEFFQLLIHFQRPVGPRPFSHYSKDELNRDYRLGAIINLCYKYGIDTTDATFDHLRGYDPYYDWLMDMGHFNYDDFNPRWVSEYQTKYYFDKMKNYPVIREKILAYIMKNYDPLLKDSFIGIYGDVRQ